MTPAGVRRGARTTALRGRVSFRPCRSGWCSQTTACSCGKASSRCSRPRRTSRSSPRARTSPRSSRRSRPSAGRRRDGHPHAARRRATRASSVAALLRETHPDVGVVVLSQYAEPALRARAARVGLGRARLPAQGARARPGAARRRRRGGRRGGSVIDPKVVEVLVAAKARAERSPAGRAHAARARGAGRDRPGQEQRARSPSRSS